jgi:uncharacterized membrane protein
LSAIGQPGAVSNPSNWANVSANSAVIGACTGVSVFLGSSAGFGATLATTAGTSHRTSGVLTAGDLTSVFVTGFRAPTVS